MTITLYHQLQGNSTIKNHNPEFIKCNFITQDGYQIKGIFKKVANADSTIIICNGLMNTKEKLLPLIHILPKTSNILLFDARKHGESSGSLFYKPWEYGLYDFYDVIAAIDWVKNQSNIPIILYGNCAGGFIATHALLHLIKTNNLQTYPIVGIIFDSGWGSRLDALKTGIRAKLSKTIRNGLQSALGPTIANYCTKSARILQFNLLLDIISLVFYYALKPLFLIHENATNIYEQIDHINIPFFFVHSTDDSWVSITHAIKMSFKVTHKKTWWISKPSIHAGHHLKYPEEYKQNIADFFATIISKNYMY